MKVFSMWENKNSEISRLRSSQRWKNCRRAVLLAQPVCEICGIHPAIEVHHIHLATVENMFEPDNLAALCCDCHERIHAAMRRGVDMQIFFGERAK